MRTTLRHFALLATIASASSFAVAQDAATQAGRRQADQSPLSTQAQSQTQGRAGAAAQAGRAGQADQVGGQAGRQAAGMNVAQFLAHELRRGNEAEVELGRIASEKAQNDQVKKFAQMMVEHHTPFIQQLQQIEQRGGAAGQGAAGQGAAGQGAAGAAAGGELRQRVGQSETDSQDRSDQDQSSNQGTNRRGQGNVRNSESGTDGEQQPQGARAAGGASQATTTAGQAPGTATPGSARATAGQAAAGQAGAAAAGGMSGQVPQQLVAVIDQACDTELQMTKEMLQQHEGQDFDMGYIGHQIVAHTQMLAKLQAIRNSGPQELQQLAMQSEQVAREHLDMAKQIADQIKNKGESGSQSPTRSARAPGADASGTDEQK